jgi:hypothetical protein
MLPYTPYNQTQSELTNDDLLLQVWGVLISDMQAIAT